MIFKNYFKVGVIILLFAGIFKFPSHAQVIKDQIAWSKEYKTKTIAIDILGQDGENIYVLRRKNKLIPSKNPDYLIEQLDLNGKHIREVPLDFDGKRIVENVFMIKDEILVFTSEKKNKTQFLYAHRFNKKSMLVEPSGELMTSFEYSGGSFWNKGEFKVVYSKDEDKVLAYYKLPYSSREHEQFGLFVYDLDFNLLWKREIELPYEDKLFEVENFILDNKGAVHLLATLYKEKRKAQRRGEPNYNFLVITYKDEKSKPIETTVELDGLFLLEMAIGTRDGETLICAGFFSENKHFSIKGIYAIQIDISTGKIIKHQENNFSLDFITSVLSEKRAKKAKKKSKKGKNVEISNVNMRHLILHDDNSISIVGEKSQFVVHTHTSTDANGNMTTTTTYHYINSQILVASLNENMEMNWVKNIGQKQHVRNIKTYNSFLFHHNGHKFTFIFNDHTKNNHNLSMEYNDLATFTASPKRTQIVRADIDAAGTVKYQTISRNKKEKKMLSPELKIINGFDDQFIMYRFRGKRHQFGLYKVSRST
ncbi:MAG: hypothetical protein JJU02_04450 [Cryomorphaceae bacterium]|nr:hypothetical protein [Cryomorphaceae bacterium]